MARYILTGTPGAGKTTLLRALAARDRAVVEEAATDVIAGAQAKGRAEPWLEPRFIEEILRVQVERQRATPRGATTFFDRSPICTHALCLYLARPVPPALDREIARLLDEGVYARQVFFIENLGFCEPSAARRISFEDSLVFERVHAESYHTFGFELLNVAAAPTEARAEEVLARVPG